MAPLQCLGHPIDWASVPSAPSLLFSHSLPPQSSQLHPSAPSPRPPARRCAAMSAHPPASCAAVASSALEFTGLSLHHNDSQGDSPDMQPTDDTHTERTIGAMPQMQLSGAVASATLDGPSALPSPPPLTPFTHTSSGLTIKHSSDAPSTVLLSMPAVALASDARMISPDSHDQTATSLLPTEATTGPRTTSTTVGEENAAATAAATAGATAPLEPHAAPPRKQQRGRRMRGRPMHSHVAFMLKKLRAEQQRQSEIDESQPTETESSDNEQTGESSGSHRRGVSFAQTLTQQRFFLSDEQTDRLHDTATPARADAATATATAAAAAAAAGDGMDSELAATCIDEQQPSAAMEPPSESDAMEDEGDESGRAFSSLRGSPSLPRSVSPPPADFGASDASPPAAPLLKSILKRRRNDDADQTDADAMATAAASAAPPGRSLPEHAKRQRRGHHLVACALGNAKDAAASAAALQQAGDAALSACTSLADSCMSPMLQQLLYGNSVRNSTALAPCQPRSDAVDRCDAAMDESGGSPPQQQQQQSQSHAQSPTEPLRHFAPPPLPPFAEDAHMQLMHSPATGGAAANCDSQAQHRAASVSPYFSHAASATLQSPDERKDSAPPASSSSSSHAALALPHDWAQGWRAAAATSNATVSQCS